MSNPRDSFVFDWADLAFGSKSTVDSLHASFIAAPRELSAARYKQLIKELLPKGNIIIGLAKEPYIDGFEGQPQFRTLQGSTIQALTDAVNTRATPHKIYQLHYQQRETKYLLDKLRFREVIFVNGSWKYSFHTQDPFYVAVRKAIPYRLVSPFADEQEAKAYEQDRWPQMVAAHPTLAHITTSYTERQLLARAATVAKLSYDHSFQTGVCIGKRIGKSKRYHVLGQAFNKVVPYQTYALHHGASREQHFSAPHDLNHYDTVHAETEMIIAAGRQGIDLHGTSLFINLLPCPACARMLADTDIAEIIYTEDHSAGYAIQMLEQAGKTVRRLV